MKTVVINGKTYDVPRLDLNDICRMEEFGAPIGKNVGTLTQLRAFVALCINAKDIDTAGVELQNHIVNGGSIEEISEAFGEAVEESGFFQAFSSKAEEGTPKAKEKKRA